MQANESEGLAALLLHWIEIAALGIEFLAVAIIVLVTLIGTLFFIWHFFGHAGRMQAYASYKEQLGRGLLLGLEILVAADIVRTVALEPSLTSVAVLAVLVVVRTFLSWSLVVEIEHRWPWQRPDGPTERP